MADESDDALYAIGRAEGCNAGVEFAEVVLELSKRQFRTAGGFLHHKYACFLRGFLWGIRDRKQQVPPLKVLGVLSPA